ncbi:MAG: NAD(P)H-dependent oxidoreductase, partial [Pseudomonadota bacterium]
MAKAVFNGGLNAAKPVHDAAKTGPYGDKTEPFVTLKRAEDTGPDDLLESDGYIFVGPENLAALSGEMKAFLDRCYYPVLGKIEGRPYVHLVCAGSDGKNAVRQLARIVTGWRLKAVQEPLIVNTAAQTEDEILALKVIGEADLDKCRE